MLYWMIFYLSLFDLGAFFRLLGSGGHSKFALLMVVKSFFNDLADAPCLTFSSWMGASRSYLFGWAAPGFTLASWEGAPWILVA